MVQKEHVLQMFGAQQTSYVKQHKLELPIHYI